jgi:hypothetical protein
MSETFTCEVCADKTPADVSATQQTLGGETHVRYLCRKHFEVERDGFGAQFERVEQL